VVTKTILIVDDDPVTLAFIAHLVRSVALDHIVLMVSDGDDALKELAGRFVPLLITDYLMPGMNGIQLSAAVKAVSPATHVVLLTADDTTEIQDRAAHAQVNTFLPKGSVRHCLLDVVQAVLYPARPPAH
jgi:two-component system, response regulator, stage 0 sporulation protein F